jgi:DNA invertase Pin-like site-specific DNA recombinase
MAQKRTSDNYKRGEDHPLAKFSNHEIELIRQLRDDGFSYGEIAKKFDTSKSTIQHICTFKRRM